MRNIFVINPMAGKNDMTKPLKKEMEALQVKDSSFQYEVVLTEYEGHGKELARKYAKEAQETDGIRIYACGGDGTLNEVMSGVYGYNNIEVGCVPYGTGNDYVKNFCSAEEFKNLENNVKGESVTVDMLETSEGIAAEVCSLGFDANVGYNTRHYKKLPLCQGKMAYNLSVVECLLHPIGTRLKITIDNKVFEDDYLMVCVANGTTYGGGFKCAPEASVCDGVADVIIVNKVSRFAIAKIISKYSDGTYQEDCEVIPQFRHCIQYLKGRHIIVEGPKNFVSNLDGECKVQNYIDVKLVEKSMRFILPRGVVYNK